MNDSKVEIKTADGVAPCYVYHPDRAGSWPAVIFYMDGMGIRPRLLGQAQRLASSGYYVMVPDLYYRAGNYPPFNHDTLQDDKAEQARLMELVKLVTNAGVMRDTTAFLDFFARQPTANSRRIGCVGYCMGGPLALSAAGTFPDQVAAAASFHGANLASDRPDSPHLLAPRMRARIYIGVAEFDPWLFPGETPRIDAALREAGADYKLEMYPGRHHGFALDGSHGYEAEAYERHWSRLLDLFRSTLSN